GKGAVAETVARAVIEGAAAAGKPVVVDPKGLDYAAYRGATVITPNVHDAGQAANVHVEGDDDLLKAAHRLSELCDGAALLITRGAAGMTLCARAGRLQGSARARAGCGVTGG